MHHRASGGQRGAYSRRQFLQWGAAGLACAAAGAPAIGAARPKTASVIVLGIDGMDPTLLMRFLQEGRMPNAQRLIERGGFAPLRTSDPPQSPVAWSNVITGTNPGGHGIYDFIARDPSTLAPYLSTSRVAGGAASLRLGGWNIPLSRSRMENLRGGATFWNDLEEHGVDCTVLRMPANFPPTAGRANTLSGLGTPDIHGGYGIFTLYTDRKSERSRDVSGGRMERVDMRGHTVECTLPGPANTLAADRKPVNIPFTVCVDPLNPAAMVSIQGRRFVLAEGEWSDWVEVRFPLLPAVAEVPGVCRFFLKKARNDFALYVSPVNLDPADPFLPISTPPSYARELAQALGRFYTQGMAEDTSALSAGALSDDDFRAQAGYVLRESRRLFEHELGRFKRGLFFFYFSSLDLCSHAFWRTMDRQHPLYSEALAAKQGDFLPWLYGQMDEVIGRALERMDDRTVLMVISDHGFGSFRRQVNLNSWLMDSGYAVPQDPLSRGHGGYFANVKWTETKAYGLGINGLYLNLKGREPEGVVAPGEEQERVTAEIVARLSDLRDPATGERAISNVYRPAQIYSGPHVDRAPDLLVAYAPNYRASWETILGGYPRQHILDNRDAWSGDHVFDSLFMSGVFLCNRRATREQPALLDLAPTILTEFGVPVPREMTGRNVL